MQWPPRPPSSVFETTIILTAWNLIGTNSLNIIQLNKNQTQFSYKIGYNLKL